MQIRNGEFPSLQEVDGEKVALSAILNDYVRRSAIRITDSKVSKSNRQKTSNEGK